VPVSHLQYVLVLTACVAVTLPLELVVGVRVWRQPRRLAAALGPVVIAFVLWDMGASAAGTWRFAERYTLGLQLPGGVAIEELAFFVVIPTAGLLTLEAVRRLQPRRLDSSDRRARPVAS
jgi:lycopene cyclase domain-containing protein